MRIEFKLPDLGEDAGDAAEVSFWKLEEGASFAKDEPLVEMLTEKASFEVPAPADGVLVEIRAREGTDVEVGGVLAVIETEDEG